jgi:hypothetical protein
MGIKKAATMEGREGKNSIILLSEILIFITTSFRKNSARS